MGVVCINYTSEELSTGDICKDAKHHVTVEDGPSSSTLYTCSSSLLNERVEDTSLRLMVLCSASDGSDRRDLFLAAEVALVDGRIGFAEGESSGRDSRVDG
jgi:hypothetical protein